MAQHIQKNKFFIFIFIFLVLFVNFTFAENKNVNFLQNKEPKPKIIYFGYGVHIDLHIILGFGYIFNLNTDAHFFETPFSFHTPIGLAVDVRFVEWFSIFSGVEFLYEMQSFKFSKKISNDKYISYQTYYHNLQLEVPLVVKFYPFVYKSDNYERMFFSAGLVAHFSPGRFYQSTTETKDKDNNTLDSKTQYGNANTDSLPGLFPSSCYVPANVGIRLSMGNTFLFKNKGGIGLELFIQHLFIPTINGYLSSPQYITTNNPFVDFSFTVGLTFSIAIVAYNSEK